MHIPNAMAVCVGNSSNTAEQKVRKCTRLAWEQLRILQEELVEVSRERSVWASVLIVPPLQPGVRDGTKWSMSILRLSYRHFCDELFLCFLLSGQRLRKIMPII